MHQQDPSDAERGKRKTKHALQQQYGIGFSINDLESGNHQSIQIGVAEGRRTFNNIITNISRKFDELVNLHSQG